MSKRTPAIVSESEYRTALEISRMYWITKPPEGSPMWQHWDEIDRAIAEYEDRPPEIVSVRDDP